MKNLIASAAIVCLLASLGAVGPALADQEMLTVTQDESSMERAIENYLKTHEGLDVREKTAEQDDLYLIVPVDDEGIPDYRISIDTQALHKDDGKVTERAVLLQVLTGVKVPQDKQAAVIRVINDFDRDTLFSTAYVDADGEVVMDWGLNVLAAGLPMEYVSDALARAHIVWNALYQQIRRVLE